MKTLKISRPFTLETGVVLPELDIAYDTYGALSQSKDNVVWVCHALTANSEAMDWWSGLVGHGKLFDPAKHFIVCANNLGSCYGATGPLSIDPRTGKPYGKDFPDVTVRDMVRAHQLLADHLGIDKIYMTLGGSMGGQQVLEWAVMQPERLEHIGVLASNAQHSPWGIAFNEAQRMAILADETLFTDHPEAGRKGLEAARAIAMLSYRSYEAYGITQAEDDDDKIGDYRASSYQRYQGYKLWKRFNPLSYLSLSKTMDTHHLGRGRGGVIPALRSIQAKAIVIGIDSDLLFPISEQRFIAEHIPHAQLEIISSDFGHDGFLVEFEAIALLISSFLQNGKRLLPASLPRRMAKPPIPKALPGTERF